MADPALEIPERLDDVTASWLSRAIHGEDRAESLPELRLSLERIGEGVGLMGELARVRIHGADDAWPSQLIVKIPGSDVGNRASGQLLGVYEREARFYLELARDLPVRTPLCLHAAYEPDPRAPDDAAAFERSFARLPIWLMRLLTRLGEWLARRHPRGAILVLEDLDGLRAGDQLAGGDAHDWRLAIETLARLHASGWEREEWLGREWVARMRPNVRFNQALFSRQYRRMRAPFTDRLGPDGRRLGNWLSRNGVALMEALTAAPDTLCHSDYRLDNLFFDDARSEVIVLDWQLPARGPGVLDLAYFLSGVLGPDVDRTAEEACVRRYHEVLVAAGVSSYSWPRCLADYRRAVLATWQRCLATASSVESGDARGIAMLESWWDRMSGRLGDLEPDSILATVEAQG